MIAEEAEALGDHDCSRLFTQRASARSQAIQQWLWNDKLRYYADYDLDATGVREEVTAASAFALFVGLARQDRASAPAEALRPLLPPGGLMTTGNKTEQQSNGRTPW